MFLKVKLVERLNNVHQPEGRIWCDSFICHHQQWDFVAVIFKNRSLLRIPYNTLVLSLAITDLITGRCSISPYPTLIEKLMTRSRTAFMVLPLDESVVSLLNNIDSCFHY